MREVVLLAFEGVEAIDVASPASAFSKASLRVPGAYRVRIASPRGGAVATSAGFALADTLPLHAIQGPIDTLVVAGGEEDALRRAIFDEGAGHWLAEAAPHARRVASVCTGAFVLAAAGLLRSSARPPPMPTPASCWRSCAPARACSATASTCAMARSGPPQA